MDITTIIIGLVLLGFFVVPIIILSAGSKKKALVAELKEWAAQNQCEIAEHDAGAQFAIGLSNKQDQVFFVRKTPSEYTFFKNSISTKAVNDCTLRNTNNDKNSDKGMNKLEISFRGASQKNTSWLLYDGSTKAKADQELALAKKWVSLIKGYLK